MVSVASSSGRLARARSISQEWELAQEGGGGVLVNDHLHVGVAGGEAHEDVAQQVGGDGGEHAEGEGAAQEGIGLAGLVPRGLDLLEDADGAVEKGLAVGGEFSRPGAGGRRGVRPARPRASGSAAEGGLRDAALLGGAGEIPRARHGDDVAELVHFHRCRLSLTKEQSISTIPRGLVYSRDAWMTQHGALT